MGYISMIYSSMKKKIIMIVSKESIMDKSSELARKTLNLT